MTLHCLWAQPWTRLHHNFCPEQLSGYLSPKIVTFFFCPNSFGSLILTWPNNILIYHNKTLRFKYSPIIFFVARSCQFTKEYCRYFLSNKRIKLNMNLCNNNNRQAFNSFCVIDFNNNEARCKSHIHHISQVHDN